MNGVNSWCVSIEQRLALFMVLMKNADVDAMAAASSLGSLLPILMQLEF